MGTRYQSMRGNYKLQDHPHAYGDKSFNYSPTAHIQGSSPRVWGQGLDSVVLYSTSGIIPTRMGTSLLAFWGNCDSRDHPHAYGDKLSLHTVQYRLYGSSPRVWGQDSSSDEHQLSQRIIPTRMGTRFPRVSVLA